MISMASFTKCFATFWLKEISNLVAKLLLPVTAA
jgi:hypothetical protein